MNLFTRSLIALAITLLSLENASALRTQPTPVPPVVLDGVRYLAPVDQGEQQVVEAHDLSTDALLWKVVLPAIPPTAVNPDAPKLPTYPTFIKSLRAWNHYLITEDETGRHFLIFPKTRSAARTLSFSDFSMADYAAGPANWDDQATPVLTARISNLADWRSLIQPRAVMPKSKPYEPSPEMFDADEILIAATVCDASEREGFRFDHLTYDPERQIITVHLTGTPKPMAPGSYSIISVVGCQIKRTPQASICFVREGKTLATIPPKSEH